MVLLINASLATLFLIVTLLPSFCEAHHYLSWPTPRERNVHSGPSCENDKTTIPKENTFEAGSWFVPRHGKSNHNGGFDIYSLVELQAKPAVSEMIDEDNIFHIECQTLNCVTPDFNQPGGVFINVAGKGQEFLNNSCWGSGFNWPNTPGDHTLFWYTYGAFGSNGIPYQQLTAYSNCANVRLTQSKTPSENVPKCTFGGGDDTYFEKLKRKSTNQECGYKRFKNPPLTAETTNAAIRADEKLGKNQDALMVGVAFGVPDMVSSGKCAIIENPMKITDGPFSGNNNKMPGPPPNGYTYKK